MRNQFIVYTVIIFITFSCTKKDFNVNLPITPVNLSIPDDSIKLNPYGYTPLSAIVNFSSAIGGKTVIIVKGKHGYDTDIRHVFNDNGLSHSVQIIGLYANYENTIDIRLINNAGDTLAKATIKIQTGSLPVTLPTSIETDTLLNDRVEAGLKLVSNLSTDNPHIPLLVDNYGDIRWIVDYTNHPVLNHLYYDDGIRRLRNGNFFFGDTWTNTFYEIDLCGKILNAWDLNKTGYIFHHDIYEKPDGNFISSVSKKGSLRDDGSPSVEDYIIEINRASGDIQTVWDLKESLDQSRFILANDKYDWIHVNAVLYDSTDNTIIVSGRLQGVIKLTFDNKIKWIIAPHRGWGTNGRGEDLNQFLLTPLAADGKRISDTAIIGGAINHADFEWCWHQHSTIQLPNGNLMLFDNGTVRNYNPSATSYSRAVEYKIDPINMTIQQKWQYGKERGPETFSRIISSVQFLPNTNHVLFCPGYLVPNDKGRGGKVIEVDYITKQVVLQLSLTTAKGSGFHRAKCITAYPQ